MFAVQMSKVMLPYEMSELLFRIGTSGGFVEIKGYCNNCEILIKLASLESTKLLELYNGNVFR